MMPRVLIAGAGIGGLAAALACRQQGCEVKVLETTQEFGEVGAGIQLGPNAMKVLAALGLEREVIRVASVPEAILIADAVSGKPISRMLLGEAARQRYGQTYLSIHRADLHDVLLGAAAARGVKLLADQTLQKYEQATHEVTGFTQDSSYTAEVLVGADGLWSRVREQLVGDGAPRSTGHAAFRAVLPSSAVPLEWRTPHVRVWWGRKIHVVSYPLRAGALWNVVVLAEVGGNMERGWVLSAEQQEVMALTACAEPQLQALLRAAQAAHGGWRRWNLFDRLPFDKAMMAKGRVALLGDAAHPMLPYLAQGAAMALEDAWVLGQSLKNQRDSAQSLKSYAAARAERNSRVVKAARRNGWIFHLSGPAAIARNAFLSIKGTAVVDMPWLYDFNSCASEP
jgi:salicylate hydroxylase